MMMIRSSPISKTTVRSKLYNKRLWRLWEQQFECGTVCVPMDLSVVPEREYVCVQISIFWVMFYKMAEFGDNGAAVPLDLTLGLPMIGGFEHISNIQESTDVLENASCELFSIMWHQNVRRAIGHDLLGYKCVCHLLRCEWLMRNGTNKVKIDSICPWRTCCSVGMSRALPRCR